MQTVRSKDGTTIAFEKYGSGEPVILVGGALNNRNSPSTGAPLAALLSASFTVYAYDRRGRGSSGDTPPYAVEREIEDLEALVREAGGSANVFGLSSGAILSLEAAARGLSIKKLAVFEPPYNVSAGRPSNSHVSRVNELITSGCRGEAIEFFMTQIVEMPGEVVAHIRSSPNWAYLEQLAHTLVYDLTIVGDGAMPVERIAAIRTPTLMMLGGKSPAWMREAGEAVANALPNAQVRFLEDQNHAAAPGALAPELMRFFNS